MNVFKDYSSNRLPFIGSLWDYYGSSFPFPGPGYQPVFNGEVGEVPGVPQDFHVHPALLVSGFDGLNEVILFELFSKFLLWKYYVFQFPDSPP
jgi:hypothetical protein